MWQVSSVKTAEVSEAEALQAAREFATVLAETPGYQAFDQAQLRLRRDAAAQEAIRAFQERQQSLQMMLMLGALSAADRDELQRLQRQMLAQPTVQTYVEAQEQLSLLCQEAAGLISEVIGLSFAASCGPGCC
ncbi:MAG: YlbF family regulator [Anaerolineae bacterium]